MTETKRYPQTILATACIPWTGSYEFDEEIFRNQVRSLVERGISHIYLFGTAGEGYAVTDEQFESVAAVFADEMKAPGLHPMAGLISLSFPGMVKRLEKAYSLGIRNFQFALPCWGMLSDNELFAFFHQLCDPFPDCKFTHYNLMRSKRLLGIREYEKLAQEIPNFAGVKFSTADLAVILEIARSACPLRFFLTECGFGYGSMVGEFGFLISIATSNIKRAREYFQAGVAGNRETLAVMQQELFLMLKALVKAVGSSRIDGAYDKIFCRIIDEKFPLRLLPPYECASDESFFEYRNILEKEFPQWLEPNRIPKEIYARSTTF